MTVFARMLCACTIRRLLSPQASRSFTTSCVWCRAKAVGTKSHYTALGITPAATQADVKAAYYKLTKVYHPDRLRTNNAVADSEEHIQKFREVTAAYEVLGNVKLRKLYDKGMHHIGRGTSTPGTAWRAHEEDNDPTIKFYKSREVKSRPPPPTNSRMYDFDEWSKQHYGATFARDRDIRRKRQVRQDLHSAKTQDVKVERVLIVMSVLVVTLLIISADMSNHDQVTYDRRSITSVSEANKR